MASLRRLLLHPLLGGADVALVHLDCEPQRVEGLAEALFLGADIDEHEGLGVAAEAVLEQVGQLGVAVGHVGRLGERFG